jgi:DNA-binding HxlR family transcriptional regulator
MDLTNQTSEAAEDAALAVSPAAARERMTTLSARGYMKIRHVLIQLPRDQPVRVSTVGRLLTARKHRALVVYLMLLMCWPWLKDQRKPLEATVWVRALTTSNGLTWSPSTLSRAWNDLAAAGLITREREGRNLRITPRREDAGGDYEIPAGARDRWNTYFTLPDTFWLDETFAKLSFPGLAMLLIIAGETSGKPELALPYEWAKQWYGLSAKSVQNGIKDLDAHGLIHKREERIPAPLSPTGFTTRIHYSLTGDYGHEARAAMQALAKKERDKRTRQDAVKTAGATKKTGKARTPTAKIKRKAKATTKLPARSRTLLRRSRARRAEGG